MKKKILLPLALLLLILSFFAKDQLAQKKAMLSYPNFYGNPHIDSRMQEMIKPYLFPLDHPIKSVLDSIFSRTRATENEKSLADAGFITIGSMPVSFVTVARHPAVPGYVFKLYLDTEKRTRKNIPAWEWLTKRCMGAENIRQIIKKEKMKHFTIPDKWLYILPVEPVSKDANPHPLIVVETDMELEDVQTTKTAWESYVTKEHLKELYSIVKHGYGTVSVVKNVPYTKKGTFAFTDTEYPFRKHNLREVKTFLSKEMQEYWDSLCEKKKKTKNKSKHSKDLTKASAL